MWKRKVIAERHVKSGRTVSCGCHREKIKTIGRTGLAFKVSDHPLHGVWEGIKQRCYNPNHVSYCNYGRKGVILCEDWLNFKNFYDWSVENGWGIGLSINRKDSNNNYSPENCEWISLSENISEMANRHKHKNTGAYNKDVLNKIKEINRLNLGVKFRMFKGSEDIEFGCLLQSAEYICKELDLKTDPKQIKKNISACLNGRRKSCHGYHFERC
jgi:hypothetical protein